ncbi:MAG: hypothetical protein H6709_06705 [Kofleriaceae bacterium]|nr:hypothetical protein [Myxococcales bacterium]MCB9560304.1 hypothetical protein [Kofleriaceae bacterium]MCB9571766.1 hypothetical protein [Kofleriaceae bacterium]
MIEDFNQLPWHDAVLADMRIDRSEPGYRDCVTLVIIWPDETRQRIIFDDCYRLRTDMNFGVIAPDFIYSATAVADAADVSSLVAKWRAIGAEIEGLARFEIMTSSTGSMIQVFARSFRVEDLE